MPYKVRTTDTARREVRVLPGHVRQPIRRLVDPLADDPTPARTKELRGLPGRYRARLLNWRIIYRVDQDTETVVILTVRRKRAPETYRDIE